MQNNKPTILTINPGTRYLGVAVFEGTDLIDWGVKVLEGKWSSDKPRKVAAIISDLITEYRPELIAMKKNHPSRTSSQLEELRREIECLSRDRHIPLQSRSVEEIGAFFGNGAKTSSSVMAELVSSQYPALARLLSRERRSSNHYHSRMFEAVGLGVMISRHAKHTC